MWKKIIEWLAVVIAKEIFLNLIVPIGTMVIAIILSQIDGFPLTYIYLSVSAALALGAQALYYLDKWRYRNRVENKLVFNHVIFNISLENNLAFYIGLKLCSLATFPLQVEVISIQTSFERTIPENFF